jgi:uncharacterized cupin superfamily protein
MGEFKRPFAVDALAWEPWSHGERFGGLVKHLGRHAGATHVGVNLEELPPGKQSCPLHYHMLEEEHLYILEGRPTLRLGGERLALVPGDYVCFPAGQAAGHALVNETDAPCRYLIIGERNPNDVIVYPDSAKVMVRSAGKIFRGDATVDYWDGEH